MEPLRVLHVVTIMDRGGLETRLMDIYRSIDKTKIQFDFLTHRKKAGCYDDEIHAMGGKVFYLCPISPQMLLTGRYNKMLNEFFKFHRYAIVHVHLTELSAFSLIAAKKAGVQVRIAHSRAAGAMPGMPVKRIFKRIASLFVWNSCTHAFAVSQKAGKWLYGKKPFIVLPNAIDAKSFCYNPATRAEARRQAGIQDSLVIGHVGRFSIEKNHGFVLDIFSEIQKMHPHSVLMMVGTGETEDAMKKKVSSWDIKNQIRFCGRQLNMIPYYQMFDVFLLPSIFEGFPGVGLEAQAAGLPCIFSEHVTEEIQIIKDRVSFLPLSNNSVQWAREALRICKTPRRNTFEEIVEAGYDIHATAKWYERFYEEPAAISKHADTNTTPMLP